MQLDALPAPTQVAKHKGQADAINEPGCRIRFSIERTGHLVIVQHDARDGCQREHTLSADRTAVQQVGCQPVLAEGRRSHRDGLPRHQRYPEYTCAFES